MPSEELNTNDLKLSEFVEKFTNILYCDDYSLFKELSNALKLLTLVLIFAAIIISFPWLVSYIVSTSNDHVIIKSMASSPESWKIWLTYFTLLLEISLGIFVGGTVFCEWLVSASKNKIVSIQEQMHTASLSSVPDVVDDLLQKSIELEECLSTLQKKYSFKAMFKSVSLIHKIFNNLYGKHRKFYQRLLVSRLIVAFPGGLFGLISFVLFFLLIILRILGIYVDAVQA